MVELRTYQTNGIELARAARRAGHRRILLSAPTGSGKTIIAVAMIARALEMGARVLVIAHRKELIDQFFSQLLRAGITAGVMRADDVRTDATLPVQLGTIQTLGRRDLPPADIVFVDEAHRCPGESYQRVLAAYPAATIFGLTATPARLDGKPLREHFDVLVPVAAYSTLIDAGAIAAPIVYAPRNPPDMSRVRRVAGDYHDGDLQKVMSRVHVVGDVARTWLQRAEGRSTVVFAVGVEHSQILVAKFRELGVKAEHLDGTTPEAEREAILMRLELGTTQVVCNVGVLCEGWDQPRVKCCVMARPTLSLTLWMQCAGRILRPYGDQPPVILDHSGNVDRHGLPHEDRAWSLDGAVKRSSPTSCVVCANCYAYVARMPCPVCGHQTASEPRKVKERDGVLERIDANIAKEKRVVSEDPKRAYFDAQVEVARSKGFKPGYASAKWKEKYGNNVEWPPWAWSQSVKADYAADSYWQERVGKRERQRAYWQDRQAAALPTQDAQGDPDPGPDEEPRGAFDDL